MMKSRVWRLALLASLLATMLLPGTSLALTSKSTSVVNVWGTIGAFGTYTNFFGSYSIGKTEDRANTVWSVTNLGMDSLVQNGRNCSSEYCIAWAFAGKVQFLNAAGGVVATLTLPTGSCHASAHGPNDLVFQKCRPSSYIVSLSATKVRFTWTQSVQRHDGFWFNAWSATKTIAIS